jgi:hypothetical protein
MAMPTFGVLRERAVEKSTALAAHFANEHNHGPDLVRRRLARKRHNFAKIPHGRA